MQIRRTVQSLFGRPHVTPAGQQEVPQLSGGLPLIGHTLDFLRSPIALLERATAELGELAAVTVFNKRMVAMFGPEAYEAVFRAPDAQLSSAPVYKFMSPIFGRGILYDAPAELRSEQIQMMLPALKERRMRTYVETIIGEVEQSLASWGSEGVLDISDYFRLLTNYTSSHCLMGREFREGMTAEFAEIYHLLSHSITPISYLNNNLPLPAFLRRDRARARLAEMIGEIVRERRRRGVHGEDFLQTLMDARYESGKELSDDAITGLLLAAIFAGHDTSSVTASWTLLELIQAPAQMAKFTEEIDRVIGDGRQIPYHSLRELTFTECSIKEALRLHPPLVLFLRVALEDFVFKNHCIGKGSWILISPVVAGRDGKYFRDPERFDPERFAPPREEDRRDFTFIPFGGGRHKCLGNAFALQQVKIILAMLLARYEFESMGDPIAPNYKGMVVGPMQPIRLRYRARPQRMVSKRQTVVQGDSTVARPAPGCPFHTAAETPAAAPRNPPTTQFKIVLDRDLCRGHATCVTEVPDVFRLGQDGKVELFPDMAHPPVERLDKVRQAMKYCPTRAITLDAK